MKQIKPLQKHPLPTQVSWQTERKWSAKPSNQNLIFHFDQCEIFSCSALCSLLTERVDVWLGTDLNTKRFSKPQFQVPSNYPFAGCNSLRGRPTGEQNRGGPSQRKKYSKCFTSQGVLEKCASPQETWSCLSHSRAERFPLHWQTGKVVACSCSWVSGAALSWRQIFTGAPKGSSVATW